MIVTIPPRTYISAYSLSTVPSLMLIKCLNRFTVDECPLISFIVIFLMRWYSFMSITLSIYSRMVVSVMVRCVVLYRGSLATNSSLCSRYLMCISFACVMSYSPPYTMSASLLDSTRDISISPMSFFVGFTNRMLFFSIW